MGTYFHSIFLFWSRATRLCGNFSKSAEKRWATITIFILSFVSISLCWIWIQKVSPSQLSLFICLFVSLCLLAQIIEKKLIACYIFLEKNWFACYIFLEVKWALSGEKYTLLRVHVSSPSHLWGARNIHS